jgi:hypothetical protein
MESLEKLSHGIYNVPILVYNLRFEQVLIMEEMKVHFTWRFECVVKWYLEGPSFLDEISICTGRCSEVGPTLLWMGVLHSAEK